MSTAPALFHRTRRTAKPATLWSETHPFERSNGRVDHVPTFLSIAEPKASGPYSSGNGEPQGRSKVSRVAFVPLDTPRRFHVAHFDWAPYPLDFMDDDDNEVDYDRYLAAYDEMEAPNNFLACPDRLRFLCDAVAETLETRQVVLRMVVEFNRRAFAFRGDQWRDGLEWHCAVEVGKPLEHCFSTVNMGHDGIGFEERRVQSPVRIVLPTAAEKAGLEIATVKGGAA